MSLFAKTKTWIEEAIDVGPTTLLKRKHKNLMWQKLSDN